MQEDSAKTPEPSSISTIPTSKSEYIEGDWQFGVLTDEVTMAGAVRRELNRVPVWWATNLKVRQLRHRVLTVRMSLACF